MELFPEPNELLQARERERVLLFEATRAVYTSYMASMAAGSRFMMLHLRAMYIGDLRDDAGKKTERYVGQIFAKALSSAVSLQDSSGDLMDISILFMERMG